MQKLCLVATVLIPFTPAFSSGADPASGNKNPMAPLERFVGEWQVEGQWSDGNKLRARGVYEWGLNHKILKAKTFVMNGEKEYQRYESIMAWHPRKKCLYQISFTYDGGISEVLMEPKDSDTIHVGFTPFHTDQPANIRQVLKFKDKDHFVWTVRMKQGDEWKQLIEATWVRKNGK